MLLQVGGVVLLRGASQFLVTGSSFVENLAYTSVRSSVIIFARTPTLL